MFVNVRIAAIIIAAKVTGGGFTAKITVDTLVINVVFAFKVFGIAISNVSHNFGTTSIYRTAKGAIVFILIIIGKGALN